MRMVVLSATLMLAACVPEGVGGGSSTPSPSSPPPGELWNTAWVAESVAGKPVTPPGAITLTFGNGQAGGSSGCNSYSGGVTVKDGTIKFGMLASTMMACLEEGRMQQEFAYQGLLRAAVSFARPSSDRLEIVASDGRRAVFTAKR